MESGGLLQMLCKAKHTNGAKTTNNTYSRTLLLHAMKGRAGGFQGGSWQLSPGRKPVTKSSFDAGHEGHEGQTRRCYGTFFIAFGARENALGRPLGWICLLRCACVWTWIDGNELQEKTVSTKKVVPQGKFELT